MKVILPDTIRSKKNSKQIVTIGGVNSPRKTIILPSKAYKKWELQARKVAKMQVRETLTGPVEVKALIYYKGRRPDLSGALESIGDCLEGICWDDDIQIVSWDGSRLIHDLKDPRTVVHVNELP